MFSDMLRQSQGFVTKEEYEKLKQELFTLQSAKEQLEKEKQVLLYNISVLYKTAEAEINRKNKTIENLRKSLETHDKNFQE